ncbi:DUF2750 domain-containing protein [Capnocytophaga sp. ARDL2]|uniref:DUF2750 domain-containing protein n=1 Tax=Capnocytophaga sp. ARDL2 TaxID=3238809 RepID=UPI0035578F4D
MKTFVQKIVSTDKIFTLNHQEEVAFVGSNLFTMNDGSPVPVWCFWSDENLARKHKQADWSSFEVMEIPLGNFLEDILVSITNEGYIVGFDFNEELIGTEVDPIDLLLEIITQLKANHQSVEFEYFKDLNDLETQARKLL